MSKINLKEFESLDIEPLIADKPAEPRDSSRLLVLNRKTGEISDRHFRDLPELLPAGTLMVLNNSKVWKARLTARKTPGGGHCELLLTGSDAADKKTWKALCRKMKPSQEIELNGGLKGICSGLAEDGAYEFKFEAPMDEKYLAEYGDVPLPQYILNARKRRGVTGRQDDINYQTVYADPVGSIAAPTAGFHFTENLFDRLGKAGIRHTFVTLHIGWGTFKPVREEDPEKHIMMTEHCYVSPETAGMINSQKDSTGKLLAVGTSSMRTMEAMFSGGHIKEGLADADLFIYPGYKFKSADIFITNLHVPSSAPLYMTAAFAGRELLFEAYRHAVESRYRFYSYGDSMLIM